MSILYFLIGIVVGGIIERNRAEGRVGNAGTDKAVEVARQKKLEAKGRIMTLFSGKTELTNDDVQQALGVSDATATNYLSELEAEGKILQVGGTGSGVSYRKNG